MNARFSLPLLMIALVLAACGDETMPPAPLADLGTGDGSSVCATDAECDDGVFCNGMPMCRPGAVEANARGCVLGAPGVMLPCSVTETCDEATRSCAAACDADGDGSDAASCGGDDCDDGDAAVFPGNSEVCDATGRDEDCNPTTLGPDGDGDGFLSTACCNTQTGGALHCGDDCNDTAGGANVHAGAPESCNGADDDCNGATDEGVQTACYADADDDGYAVLGTAATLRCVCGAGYTAIAPVSGADCDDTSAPVHPGVLEVCNTLDDDCNGVVDEGVTTTYYPDGDGDGFAVLSGAVQACAVPIGYLVSASPEDCNDSRTTIYPGAPEICDGQDSNCMFGLADELGCIP